MAIGGPLRAGQLRRRVTVRRARQVDDGHGGETREWFTPAILRAQVEGQDGREAVIAHALEGISTYRITTRYRSDLQDSDQLVLDDALDPVCATRLNITSITDPDGRRIQLQIIATTAGVVPEQ